MLSRGRSMVLGEGLCTVSWASVPLNRGRWIMASEGTPWWLGIRVGKMLASLLSTPVKSRTLHSVPSQGSKVARPTRSQWKRSGEEAMAMRGPLGPWAV